MHAHFYCQPSHGCRSPSLVMACWSLFVLIILQPNEGEIAMVYWDHIIHQSVRPHTHVKSICLDDVIHVTHPRLVAKFCKICINLIAEKMFWILQFVVTCLPSQGSPKRHYMLLRNSWPLAYSKRHHLIRLRPILLCQKLNGMEMEIHVCDILWFRLSCFFILKLPAMCTWFLVNLQKL